MKKIYLVLVLSLSAASAYSQCTARPLPFTEGFPTTALTTCTPTQGGWVGTTSASQAGWWIPSPPTNYAGGVAPEVEAYGNQANGGVSETITLTSPPINTSAVSTYTMQFKHNLYTTNGSASGSGVITLKVETSQDKVNWTQHHTASYNATSSLTSVMQETRTLIVTGNTNDSTYVRFSISGVLFKVWGWEIDAFGVISSGTTGIQNLYGEQLTVAPNPFRETLRVYCAANEATHVSIHDLLGNQVFETTTNQSEVEIDSSEFPGGVYLLQVSDKAGMRTHKIIKE